MKDYQFFQLQPTADGSYTFFSSEFNELFHSHFGAKQEAEYKFVHPLQLREKAQQSQLCLLDVCYGLGYNTAAALSAIWQVNPNCQIQWMGLESDQNVPLAAVQHSLLKDYPSPIPQYLETLATTHHLQTQQLQGQLLIGDARTTIRQLQNQGFQADGIFLDPFSPPTCPQLWTVEFLTLLSHCLKPNGYLATYSCSAAVRTALLEAKLKIGSTLPVGRKTPGTIASFMSQGLPTLSPQEQEHLQTRAAIPYRDPSLSDTAEDIITRRQQEQLQSTLEPTSHWKKRWQH